jgi:hypothetical protein
MEVQSPTLRKSSARSREAGSPAWWVPVVLAVPALIPLVTSILVARARGLIATGFIEIDQPYYFANAREYFDQGFHFLYGNPYASYDTPRIYFQPHFLLLGCFQQLGLDPGLTWVLFGIVGLLFGAFVAVRIYREVVGWRSSAEKLGLLCFFWGGGILTLVGFVYAAVVGKLDIPTVLHFDPGPSRGWWMLNFGRNLVYGPTEAYYHGVFLLSMLFLIWRRFSVAIALAALLSLSDPWTGIESSLIVAVYLAVERFYGDESVKPVHLASSGALFCMHVWYYLFFLNQFADHRAVQKLRELQGISRSWFYPPSTFLPALFIVGILATVRLRRWPGFRQVMQNPRNRLFLVWFFIVFGITQHYRVMRPIQPIHFAHGNDWIPLFFLGAPVLLSLLERLLTIEIPSLRVPAIAALLVFFLSDNIFWFATFLRPITSEAVLITREQKEVLNWLGRTAAPPDMVVTADTMLGYLVSTYTRVRSWAGYGASTPNFEQRTLESRQAFQGNVILPAWTAMHVFYIQRSSVDTGWKPPVGSKEVFRDASYAVWESAPPKKTLDTEQRGGQLNPVAP